MKICTFGTIQKDSPRAKSARTKADGVRGKPGMPLGFWFDKYTEGSHNFERVGSVTGNGHRSNWMGDPRHL